jgi:acetolactate synthase-1/2/3 large subunit
MKDTASTTTSTTSAPVTAARQLLELAARLGVDFIFTNLGSDHPAFIEAFADIDEQGARMPAVIICPHEMTALSAAHGHAMVTRRPQLVLVHVDVGTQNLGCSIHNAARGRVPAIVIAGLSPLTTSGERTGARTEYIHYTQDTSRQHEIVGQYMKWSYELRAAEMVDSVLLRGLQVAMTEPAGPVYITGAREVWDDPVPAGRALPAHWTPAVTAGLAPPAIDELHRALVEAQRPLVITTYAGRDPRAAQRLVELSERLGFAVCEVSPQYMNFPGDHPHHVGYQRNSLVDEADVILLLDVDVPWIVSKVQPAAQARIFHIDVDPLKPDFGFWHFPAQRSYCADSALVLEQLLQASQGAPVGDRPARVGWIGEVRRRLAVPALPTPADGRINVQLLAEALRALVHERTVILLEAPTASLHVLSTLRMARPGSFFASGGAGLGWGINAAIGLKLAQPEAEVITITGDGSYGFGVPSSAYWVGETYGAPQLTVIVNNGGWGAPKQSTLLVHPEGTAKRRDRYWITVGARSRPADIGTAAGGAAAFRVTAQGELAPTLREALEIVRGGRSAIVDVVVSPVSQQVLD